MSDEEKKEKTSDESLDTPDNLVVKNYQYQPMKNPEPNDIILSNNPNANSLRSENPNANSPNHSSNSSPNNSPREILNKSPTSSMGQNMQYSNIQIDKRAIMNSISDQKATIFLQRIIMGMDDEQIRSIVHELKGEYRKLILDKYGNFFCKDLFRICNQKDRSIILQELYLTLSEDCQNNFATHPIHTLIEFSYTEEDFKLILYSFNDYDKIFSATIDPNGSYVIQKIVDRIPERFRADFNKIFSSFIETACQKKYGIVAVKKFLDCTVNDSIIKTVMNLIRNKFFDLAKDQYGNYLIQFLLEKWAFFKDGQEIKNLVEKNFDILMKTKYSSFICECYNKLFNKKSQNEGKDQEKNNQKMSP